MNHSIPPPIYFTRFLEMWIEFKDDVASNGTKWWLCIMN